MMRYLKLSLHIHWRFYLSGTSDERGESHSGVGGVVIQPFFLLLDGLGYVMVDIALALGFSHYAGALIRTSL